MPETRLRETQGGCILIVEDHWNDLVLMTHVLDELHLRGRIFAAHNAAQALEFLTSMEEGVRPKPVAIFVDMKLPDLPGEVLIHEIRYRLRFEKIPIIVLSDSPVEDCLPLLAGLDVQGCYQKPARFDAFQRLFRQLLLEWAPSLRGGDGGAKLESA